MYTKKGYKCCAEFDGTTTDVVMPSGKHYAKQTCSKCGHFLKWLPNPKITEECNERIKKIDEIIKKHGEALGEKKIKFLEGVKSIRFLTPRQFEYLQLITSKFTL